LRINLKTRLTATYLVVVLFFGATAYLTVRVFNFVAFESNRVITEDDAMIRGLERLRQEVDEAIKISRLALAKQASDIEALQKRTAVTESLKELGKNALPEESVFFGEIVSHWNTATLALEQMTARPIHIASAFQKEILPSLSALGQAISDMANRRRTISFERVQKIQQALQQSHQALFIFASLLILTGIGSAWGIQRYILRPLILLKKATEHVARGDFSHRITPWHKDEMGDLAGNFNDMSERLAKEEQTKKEFVSLVTHEMKTPLAIIKGYADFLVHPEEAVSEKDKIKALECILRETVNLQDLTNDLFDVARANAGTFRIEPVATELASELTLCLKPLETLAQDKNIALTWNFSELPSVLVDKNRVGQAVRNLAVNALKFTPPDGHIHVTGKAKDHEIILEVSDDGPGIAPEELAHIFTRFYQVKVKDSQNRGGAGLGLAIVREIALAHGGRVEAESEIGKGALFRIILPLMTPPVAQGEASYEKI